MRVEFHGAAKTVTGSCTLLEAGGTRILVDCGQFQGDDALERRNRERFPFDVRTLDALVLTHGHIDHIGRAATLRDQGFRGLVICTRATAEIAQLMLLDSAKIAREDAEHGGPPPTFDEHDVEALYKATRWTRYGETVPVGKDMAVTLSDAGHILGSAHVLVTMREAGRTVRFGVSGDVGAPGRPVVADPTPFGAVEYVQVESTYGDRDHRSVKESLDEFERIVLEAEGGNGVVLVPAFSLGRTQDILYHVNRLKEAGRLPRLRVYLDSPLATKLMSVYRGNEGIFDDDARGLLRRGDDPFDFEGLHVVSDARESERLTREAHGAMIVAASGMCQGGRIVRHLQAMLPRTGTHVVMVGYQAPGTLGRRLVDGARAVRIRGSEVAVNARIHTIGGFSAHAGQHDLIAWLSGIRPAPKRAFLVHGEPATLEAFGRRITADLGFPVTVPEHRQGFTLDG